MGVRRRLIISLNGVFQGMDMNLRTQWSVVFQGKQESVLGQKIYLEKDVTENDIEL